MTRAGWWTRAGSVLLLASVVLVAGGCSKKVTRIAPEQAIDLSGRWNDVDSRLVAEEMIRQNFEGARADSWATRHMRRNGGSRPTVIVGSVRNRSMEHIPVGTFVKDLERAFINSGQVQVVASAQDRDEVRDERYDQQEYSSPETRSRLREEFGADYMLQGDIESIEDRERGRSVLFYQVDLTLVDLETNAKVWTGQHKIKKFVERPRIKL